MSFDSGFKRVSHTDLKKGMLVSLFATYPSEFKVKSVERITLTRIVLENESGGTMAKEHRDGARSVYYKRKGRK